MPPSAIPEGNDLFDHGVNASALIRVILPLHPFLPSTFLCHSRGLFIITSLTIGSMHLHLSGSHIIFHPFLPNASYSLPKEYSMTSLTKELIHLHPSGSHFPFTNFFLVPSSAIPRNILMTSLTMGSMHLHLSGSHISFTHFFQMPSSAIPEGNLWPLWSWGQCICTYQVTLPLHPFLPSTFLCHSRQ